MFCDLLCIASILIAIFTLQGFTDMEKSTARKLQPTLLCNVLMSSGLTQCAAVRAAKDEVLLTINRHLLKRGCEKLDDRQIELLIGSSVAIEDVRFLLDAIIDGASIDDRAGFSQSLTLSKCVDR